LYAKANDYDNKAFKEIAGEVGISEKLLKAICWVESRHDRHEFNQGDGGSKNHAFGMCQVLYSTAQTMGLNDPNCEKDFENTPKKYRNYKACKLFGPKTNIRYAARYLKKKLDLYDGNEFKAISAYNLGQYKVCRDGWLYYKGERFKPCVVGGPVNLYYVEHVSKALISRASNNKSPIVVKRPSPTLQGDGCPNPSLDNHLSITLDQRNWEAFKNFVDNRDFNISTIEFDFQEN
jgi:hypothetical protein